MKHFLVEITYTAPLKVIDAVLPLHRAFLQAGYERGLLLCSGPTQPRTGGVALARAESEGVLREYFAADPYQQQGVATYRFVEFNPVKFQLLLQGWIQGDDLPPQL